MAGFGGFSFRPGRVQLGPLRINLSNRDGQLGVSSVSTRLGPVTERLWSRDGTSGITSIDTPGLGSLRRTPGKRQPKGDGGSVMPPLSHTPRR